MSTQNECVWVLLSQTLADCFYILPTVGCVAIRAEANWKTGFSTSEELPKSVQWVPENAFAMQEFSEVSSRLRSSVVSMLLNHLDSTKVTPSSTPAGQSPKSTANSLLIYNYLDTENVLKSRWNLLECVWHRRFALMQKPTDALDQ